MLECVQKSEEHAQIIHQWRLDPVTQEMSFHQVTESFEQFWERFQSGYFCFPELPPLFVWEEGERVGFMRLLPCAHPNDPLVKCCEVSLNIAPNCRRKGIGTAVYKEAASYAEQQGYPVVLAEMKVENEPSIKAVEKAGYQLFDRFEKLVEDTGERVEICRYVKGEKKKDSPVFIIAEAGSNWCSGGLDQALKMIDVAADAGCDAVKFQVFDADTLYVKQAGKSDYLSKSGIETDVYALLDEHALPKEFIPKLASHCQNRGIEWMASAFSPACFEAIDPYVKRHKIASYEISHPHLLKLAAHSKKPLFLSTGASSEEEIAWAVELFFKEGGCNLTLLQCTAQYPATAEAMHLRVISWMQKRFGVPVGLSDHSTDPYIAPVGAATLGASVIEKHFTLDRSLPGPDHAFALEPGELQAMVQAIRAAEVMRGGFYKTVFSEEKELYDYACRGIQTLSDIRVGEKFEEEKNLAILRPGKCAKGIHPRFLERVLTQKAKREIRAGEGIQWEDL